MKNRKELFEKMSKKELKQFVINFHQSIIVDAKYFRIQARVGKEYKNRFEGEVALRCRALKYQGVWMPSTVDGIPERIKKFVQEIKKDI